MCHVDMRAYCTNSVFMSISWGALRPAKVYPRIARVEQFYQASWGTMGFCVSAALSM